MRKVRINLTTISYIYLILRGLFSNFGLSSIIWDALFIALLFINIIKRIHMIRPEFKHFIKVDGILLIVMVALNVTVTKKTDFLWQNIYMLFITNAIILFIYYILMDDGFESTFKKVFYPLNIFGLINLFVIVIQTQVHGFLIRPEWLLKNSYYPDLCSGFFGFNGTHYITFFYCFLILYDLYIIKYTNKCTQSKKYYYIYLLVLVVFSIYISRLNENSFFAVYLFILLFCYYMIKPKYLFGNKSYLLFSKSIYPIIAIIFLLVMYSLPVPKVSNGDFISKVVIAMHPDMERTGGNERILILWYSIKQGFGLKFGTGIGANLWNGNGVKYLNFSHFGLNSISTFVTLIGLPSFCIYLLRFAKYFEVVFDIGKDKLMFSLIAILLLISTFYTTIFSNVIIIIWFSLTIYVFVLLKNKWIHYREK